MWYKFEKNENSSRISRPDLLSTGWLPRIRCWFENTEVESFTMPLRGNMADFTALNAIKHDQDRTFLQSLRRLSLNIVTSDSAYGLLNMWLSDLTNLEFLEITVSRKPHTDGLEARVQYLIGPSLEVAMANNPLLKLAELRIMTAPRITAWGSSLCDTVGCFPSLRRLALAHFVMSEWDWRDGLRFLEPRKLDAVWLLNPLVLLDRPDSTANNMEFRGYGEEVTDSKVAKKFRIIHLPYRWGENLDRDNGDGHGYEYPGFGVFEEME